MAAPPPQKPGITPVDTVTRRTNADGGAASLSFRHVDRPSVSASGSFLFNRLLVLSIAVGRREAGRRVDFNHAT